MKFEWNIFYSGLNIGSLRSECIGSWRPGSVKMHSKQFHRIILGLGSLMVTWPRCFPGDRRLSLKISETKLLCSRQAWNLEHLRPGPSMYPMFSPPGPQEDLSFHVEEWWDENTLNCSLWEKVEQEMKSKAAVSQIWTFCAGLLDRRRPRSRREKHQQPPGGRRSSTLNYQPETFLWCHSEPLMSPPPCLVSDDAPFI